nr:leucine-rich repeat extensin-like protein 5 [Quercus suber]
MPLVCFHLIEKHTPDRVVRQFGMIQQIPLSVDTDTILHKIDLRGKVSLVNRLSRHLPLGMEKHKDIAQVLTAVHHIDRVQPPIPETLNEEATTPAGPSTTEGPSTSTTPTGCPSRPPVATPQVVPTPDSSPYTPYASPSFTTPAFPSHSSPTLTIPSYTHPSPSLTIPAFTSHPSPTLTIPSSNPHPSSSPTIPQPSPSLTIPHPAPRPTIPPPTPHPCHGSDIRPPFPQSFPELSPIPSFDLGLHPIPPEMQQEPPSHSTSIAPSSAIDTPYSG